MQNQRASAKCSLLPSKVKLNFIVTIQETIKRIFIHCFSVDDIGVCSCNNLLDGATV